MEPKHYVAAVIWRTNPETRKKEVLIQRVVSEYSKWSDGREVRTKTPPQPKFVGGMQRMTDDTVEVTLTREIVEETYLRYSGPLVPLGEPIPVPDRDNPRRIDHVKLAFLVPFSECTGELRTDVLTDGNDEMGVPYWVPLDEAGREIYRTHQEILRRAQEALPFF